MTINAATVQKTNEHKRRTRRRPGRRTLIVAFAAVVAAGVYFSSRTVVNELAARALAIFAVAAILWATEALPLFATAFAVVTLEVFFLATKGGLASDISRAMEWAGFGPIEHGEIDYSVFFGAFGQDIVILFMGGFLLSAAVVKHGVDRAIASRLLGPLAHSPALMLFGVIGITAFFSMWMSNTATATMMLAITGGVMTRLPKGDRYATGLVLGVAFGANVGGIGTPIGTPPNAIAYGALNAAGIEITFLEWMMWTVPLEIILLAIISAVLWAMFKPSGPVELGLAETSEGVTREGRVTLMVLGLAVLLWLTSGWHGLQPGAVALVAGAALTVLGVLDRRDVDSIDWNILILMWGGLSLSVAMRETGLSEVIGQLDVSGIGSGIALALAVIILGALMSTFVSNTATAGLLVPAALALSVDHAGRYAVLIALACSLAMAMPVSTPPNAIAYSTGRVPVRTMIRAGGLLSSVAVVVLFGYYAFIRLLQLPV